MPPLFSAEGLHLAGGTLFGIPGDNKMVLNTKTGFHEYTWDALPVGSAITYAYANGACSNWQCKEGRWKPATLGNRCNVCSQ